MATITHEQIKKHLDKGDKIAIVEALPEKYYAEGHLPGALMIPPGEIETKAPQLLKDKGQMIVTYCVNESCPNAKTAADKLRGLGYTNVSEYSAGKEGWKKAGLPLEGAKGSCSTSAGSCGTKTGSCH